MELAEARRCARGWCGGECAGGGLFDNGPVVFGLRSISPPNGSFLPPVASDLISKNSFLTCTLSGDEGVDCNNGLTAGSVSSIETEVGFL
jgi:hypothetical protein